MQPVYRCLINRTLKELPSIEALAERYPNSDKKSLMSHLTKAREILEDAHMRAGAELLHCRNYSSKTFKLEFEVNKQIDPRSFDIQGKVKVKDLQEALRAAEITIDALQGSEWVVTLRRVYDSEGLLVWDCDVDKSIKQVKQSQDFKQIFSVNDLGSVSEFSRIFTTESKNLAKEEGLRIERMFSDATKAITWTFIKIEDQQGNEVWHKG